MIVSDAEETRLTDELTWLHWRDKSSEVMVHFNEYAATDLIVRAMSMPTTRGAVCGWISNELADV